jgi:hypothetical protein
MSNESMTVKIDKLKEIKKLSSEIIDAKVSYNKDVTEYYKSIVEQQIEKGKQIYTILYNMEID